MAQLFTVDSHVHGDVTWIVVIGEVDISVADAFRTELAQCAAAASGPIELDLERLTYADSSALQAIVAAVLAARDRGVAARVRAVSRPVRRVMAAAGLIELLGVTDEAG
jgi:anti-anti-sigma factor